MYSENGKKSIYLRNRTDIIIIILLLFLILSPLIFNAVFRLNAKSRQKDIYISARCEEFFGGKTMETLIQEFEKQNPGLRINILNVSSEKSREPDILFFDESEFNALGAIESPLPLVSFMDLFFYNIELLQAAGFDRPPKTRDEFLAYAKTISASDNDVLAGAAGFAMALSPENKQSLSREIFSWIWAGGGNFWPDGSAAPVINTKQMAGDFTFLGKLYHEGALSRKSGSVPQDGEPAAEPGFVPQNEVLSPNIFEMTEEQAIDGFVRRQIAMIIASTRAIPELMERMGSDTFGVTTIPGAGAAGKYGVSLSGIFAGINKNSAFPDAALVFLEFIAAKSPLLCAQLKAIPGYIPELLSGDDKKYIKEAPLYAKAWDIFESSVIVRGFLGVPCAKEYEDAAYQEIQFFFERNRTAQEVVTDIQKRWDEVYADSIPQE